MTNDIRVIIGFVILLIAVCKIWNMYAMKQYEKLNEKSLGLTYGFYGNIEKLKIVDYYNNVIKKLGLWLEREYKGSI